MSFQLATAYVELQQRGFKTVTGEIDNVKNKLGGLVSYVSGPMSTAIGTAIGSMGSTIIAGLANKLAGVGSNMLKLAADAEQTEVAFTTMLGSAEAARKMLGDLSSFAATTPFEMPGIKQAARTLLAFGTSQEQVLPLLRVLGDVSAGTGKDLAELAVIFGQISATGKLTGGDLMQLTNAGVPMLATLATQLGKTTGEVKAMVEGGQISAGAVTKAFQTMSSEGGLFANMMEKQSGTLSGLWSTFSDNLNTIMLDVGNAFVDGFDLKSVVSNMSNFAERFRSDWMPSIVNAFQWTKENIVGPWLNAMSGLATSVGNLVSAIGEQFERLTAGMGSTLGGFFKWAIEGYYGTFASIIDTLANFIADFDLYWQLAYTSLGNSLNNMWQMFKTGLSNMWTVTKWFFGNFGTIAYNTVSNIGTIFMNYFRQIRNNWQSLLNFFKTGRLEFDFSPMRDSLNAILEGVEMPKIEAPQLDALRTDMDRIESQIAKRQADRLNARKKVEKQAQKTQMAELVIADDVAEVKDGEIDSTKEATKQEKKKTAELKAQNAERKKAQGGGFVGVAELAEQMMLNALKKKDEPQADGNLGGDMPTVANLDAMPAANMDIAGELGSLQPEQPEPSVVMMPAPQQPEPAAASIVLPQQAEPEATPVTVEQPTAMGFIPTLNDLPKPQATESPEPLTSTLSEAFTALQNGIRSIVERMELPSLVAPQPKLELAGAELSAPAGQSPASAVAGMRDSGSTAAQANGDLRSDLSQLGAIAVSIDRLLSLASGEGLQTRVRNMATRVGPPPSDWRFGSQNQLVE